MADDGLADQWLFTQDEVDASPSILDGITAEDERTRRAKGVNFIVQAGILLRLPQTTLATAAVFLHRFYMRYSMVPEKNGIHHYVRTALPRSRTSLERSRKQRTDEGKEELTECPDQNIAATALFLASKAEETCRKTKEIVVAVAKVAQKNANLIIDEQSKEFWRWKDSILTYEETMLELLTFDVVLKSPYKLLYDFLQTLQIETQKRLRDVAWSFINDSCMTTLCLQMPAKDIAVAAIYFSARFCKERVPDDEQDRPWWMRIGGRPIRIEEAVQVMTRFYGENPLKKPDNPYEQSPGSTEEDLEKSRLRNGGTATPNSMVRTDDGEFKNSHGDMNGSATNGDGQTNGHTAKDAKDETDRKQGAEVDTPPVKHEAAADLANGDSDAALKEAANDPATHEQSAPNGVNGIKRGAEDLEQQSVESDAKRVKIEADNNGNGDDNADDNASEEGEVEE